MSMETGINEYLEREYQRRVPRFRALAEALGNYHMAVTAYEQAKISADSFWLAYREKEMRRMHQVLVATQNGIEAL